MERAWSGYVAVTEPSFSPSFEALPLVCLQFLGFLFIFHEFQW
jgi:hypothetical protein